MSLGRKRAMSSLDLSNELVDLLAPPAPISIVALNPPCHLRDFAGS